MARYEDNKSKYQKPLAEVCKFNVQDVLSESGVGKMSWDWEGTFDPTRDSTFVG